MERGFMKKILIHALILCASISSHCISIKAITIITKKQAPYEIQAINFLNDTLTIKGWAFLSETQHYSTASDHDYEFLLESKNDLITYKKEEFKKFIVSQTDLMYYSGPGYCTNAQYNAKSTTCNYKYENVGFEANIPLSALLENEIYRVYLKISANNAKKSGIIDIYFPISIPIIQEYKSFVYSATSNLTATSLKVIDNSNLRVRTGPGKEFSQAKAGASCSSAYGNALFHVYETVYQDVYAERLNGANTWYKISGKLYKCISSRQRIIYGKDIQNIWITSNFVEYQGEPLTIKKIKLKSTKKIVRFISMKVVTDDYKSNVWTKDLENLKLLLTEDDYLMQVEI